MINAMKTKEAAAPPATAGNQLLDDSSRKDSEGNPKSPDVPILKNSIFGFQGGAPTSNLSFEVNDVLDHEQWQNSIISGWSASLNNSIESTEDARAEPEVISESSECVLSPGRRGGGGGGCHSCDHCFRRDNYSDGLRLRSNGLADAKDRPKQWVQCMLPAHSQLPLSQRALWCGDWCTHRSCVEFP